MKPTLLPIAAVAILTGCQCASPPDVELHLRLLALAGPKAVDCGRATTNRQNVAQSACAVELVTSRTPFLVQYRLPDSDGPREDGLALNPAGKLFQAGILPPALAGTAKADIVVSPCKLGNLQTTPAGYLAC